MVLFGGSDDAHLYGSSGSDVYFSVEGSTTLYGPGYYVYAGGFDAVTGDMTGDSGGSYGAAGGGSDLAYLYDGAGGDTFYVGPTTAKMSYSGGATSTISGSGAAFGLVVNGDGSADTAYLYGSGDNDVLWSWEGYSVLASGAQYNYAIGFGDVSADVTGATGGAYGATLGGSDAAYLFDSAGNDTFRAGPSMAKMVYQSTKTGKASGFDYVTAVGAYGGTDAAYLYGSSGGDAYYGYANTHTLFGTGYSNQVQGFDATEADVTMNAPVLGDDFGAASGGADYAWLFDSVYDDMYHAENNEACFDYNMDSTIEQLARGFVSVTADSSASGSHTDQVDEIGDPTFDTIYTGDGWM